MTTTPHVPAPTFWEILAGQEIVGLILSTTVTVKLQEAVKPAASVTRKVLVVVPTGNVAPEAKPAVCVVIALGQLSVPTGVVKVTTAPHVPAPTFWEILVGQEIVGLIVSVMVTV